MKRGAFRDFVEQTLSDLKILGEVYSNQDLPNDFEFQWMFKPETLVSGKESVINEIISKVYISENEIYPCVDLTVAQINTSYLSIHGSIAGFKPCPMQMGWSGRPGPFIYLVSQELISPDVDIYSEEILKKLFRLGITHYQPNAATTN